VETVSEALSLLKRQAKLEAVMKAGEFRLEEEQELRWVRQRRAQYPQAIEAAFQTAHALRRHVTEVSASGVESWARTSPSA
jgi:hypothetical protein